MAIFKIERAIAVLEIAILKSKVAIAATDSAIDQIGIVIFVLKCEG
jgi:hypothetical protein